MPALRTIVNGNLSDASDINQYQSLAKGSQVYDVVNGYGAKADQRTVLDGAITASSSTFTSATATFVAGDVGKVITVAGAGSGGALTVPTNSAFTTSTGTGAMATGTYYYRVSARNAQGGETLASTETSIAVTGPTGLVVVKWGIVNNAVDYNVYGRSSTGAELRLVTGCRDLFWSDDGNPTPSGALPPSDTSAVPLVTTISSVTNGTTVVLNASASTTVSGAITTIASDDTTPIQNAINAAKTVQAGVVLFPPGQYTSANLKIQDVANLTVTGPGAQINWWGPPVGINTNVGFQMAGPTAAALGTAPTAISNVTISDLKLNGDGVLANGHAGVWDFSGCFYTNTKYIRNHITNVVVGFEMSPDAGGSLVGGLIAENYLDNVVGTASGTGYGIHHANGAGTASHMRIINNTISRAHRHAIYQAKGSGVVIEGNVIRNHRVGDTIQGFPTSAIVCARSTDVAIVGNLFDTPNDCSIEVTPASPYSSRNVVIANNVITNSTNPGFQDITIGDTVPATDSYPELVTVSGNTIYRNGTASFIAIGINAGKRISFIGNQIYMLNVTTGSQTAFLIRGYGETSGTATYTDELMFKDNYVYATLAGGTAVYGWEFASAAATSGIRCDFISNRVNSPTTNVFLFDATQTDPNIRCFDTPIGGVLANLTIPVVGAGLGLAAGTKIAANGQTNNTVAGNVTNQGIGTVGLPALAAVTSGTVTITDSTITTKSIIHLSVARGTTTPTALGSVVVAAQLPGTGSCVVDVRNTHATIATLSTDYVLWYWVVN